jgi:7,8-dihydro-6-hydroxymethylpterin-pyrophosphokinase
MLEPLTLLDQLQSIENDLGRKKFIDKGPRNIDLDILLYDDQTVDHERLKIPHPGMYEREFVLRPLSEYVDQDSQISYNRSDLPQAHSWESSRSRIPMESDSRLPKHP